MAQIFTKEDKAKINAALTSIAEVKKEIAKAKLAGIDVTNQETELLATEAKLQGIKRVYFPV